MAATRSLFRWVRYTVLTFREKSFRPALLLAVRDTPREKLASGKPVSLELSFGRPRMFWEQVGCQNSSPPQRRNRFLVFDVQPLSSSDRAPAYLSRNACRRWFYIASAFIAAKHDGNQARVSTDVADEHARYMFDGLLVRRSSEKVHE